MSRLFSGSPLMRRFPYQVCCIIATVMLLVACRRNHPPTTPDVAGLPACRPGDTTEFSTTSTDRDDDLISYLFAWGDTSSASWSADYPSGVTVARGHAYADSGAYAVRARARDDKGAESDWSPTETLRVGFFPPGRPLRPVGPTSGQTGIAYEYTTHATSPYGESLFIQFDWGGNLGSWSAPVPSDSLHVETHEFDSSGLYVVRTRAGDKTGSVSAWSDSLAVTIVSQGPSIPTRPAGRSTVAVGMLASYSTWSVDPDGDRILYVFDWDDGWMDTTALQRSGDVAYRFHAWGLVGSYSVRTRAKDERGSWSGDWSDALDVTVENAVPNRAPDAPIKPTHTGINSIGQPIVFTTSSTDPDGDPVQIKFYFDDGGTPTYGPMVASGTTYTDTVVYETGGWKVVYAVAKDGRDTSAQSAPESVYIDPNVAPQNVTLAAATDSTVGISWTSPSAGTPNRYVVSFRNTGYPFFDSIGGTTGTSLVHDPAGLTGQYQVTAVYDSAQYPANETPGTTPIGTSMIRIPELNGTGKTGYGWSRTTGEVTLYDMTVTDSADKVDFYVTDFAQGFAGPDYFVASPDTAPLDQGGIVPAGYWHVTKFSHLDSLATEDSMLPRYLESRYRRYSILDSLPRLVACHTEDSHFALIMTTNVDTINGTADVETWFQLIPNLRLIEH